MFNFILSIYNLEIENDNNTKRIFYYEKAF